MDVRGKKIFIGLSGGVDSAVSAALLVRAGAQVTGVFIKGWYPPGMPCTWAAERRDAMRVAARLNIPFFTLDAHTEYKENVIDYLLTEYRAGRTPNPDVMCNKGVKFGAFYRFAKSHGADAIAMGHYRQGEKDQSYFLWAVPKEILAATLFPVGNFTKNEVRAQAKRFKLPVANKKDSQGVCFLGSISIEEFLRAELKVFPGRALDEHGRVVGMHEGALLFTIGQRVPLWGARKKGPWFVIAKDSTKNELRVGNTRFPVTTPAQHGIRFTNANWFNSPMYVREAQYRYRGPRITGKVENDHFISSTPLHEVLAFGQSIVFYGNDELIGGGIISV